MKKSRCLLSLLVCTAVYVLLSVVCGQNGIWAQKQLEEQRRKISAHTAKIQKVNEELKLERDLIDNDPGRIRSYARELDYVSEGETLLKINGLEDGTGLKMYSEGSVLTSTPVVYLNEFFCKAASAAVAVMFFIATLLFDISSQPSYSYGYDEDDILRTRIPIYDFEQI